MPRINHLIILYHIYGLMDSSIWNLIVLSQGGFTLLFCLLYWQLQPGPKVYSSTLTTYGLKPTHIKDYCSYYNWLQNFAFFLIRKKAPATSMFIEEIRRLIRAFFLHTLRRYLIWNDLARSLFLKIIKIDVKIISVEWLLHNVAGGRVWVNGLLTSFWVPRF